MRCPVVDLYVGTPFMDVAGDFADVEVHWRRSAEGAEESALSVVEPASEDVLTPRDVEPIADPEAVPSGGAPDVASSEEDEFWAFALVREPLPRRRGHRWGVRSA